MRGLMAGIILAAAMTACHAAELSSETPASPEDAIHAANAKAPDAVPGSFALHILSTGHEDGCVFLNSEIDYRDQRNLTIVVAPSTVTALADRYKQPPEQFFLDKNIVVDGAARREKIVFFSRGMPTDKYYYQTHIVVDDPDQIRLLGF